jgi:hypothetical protein
MASFFPIPYQSVYAATKAFVLSFSEALWFEYHNRGLRVLALYPGPTRTSLLETSLIDPEQAATPEQVAIGGLRALEQGHSSFIPGVVNNLQSRILPTVLSRSFMTQLVGRTVRSGLQAKPSLQQG